MVITAMAKRVFLAKCSRNGQVDPMALFFNQKWHWREQVQDAGALIAQFRSCIQLGWLNKLMASSVQERNLKGMANLVGAFLVEAQGWSVVFSLEVEVDVVRKNWAEGGATVNKERWQ